MSTSIFVVSGLLGRIFLALVHSSIEQIACISENTDTRTHCVLATSKQSCLQKHHRHLYHIITPKH